MRKDKRVFYKDGECHDIMGYCLGRNLVSLYYENPAENLSGFTIKDADGNIIKDCSDYVYRWDVVEQKGNVIYYTNDPDDRQKKPFPDLSNIPGQEEPLSNEELTEAVADLMYEISAAQLGV